MPTKLQPQTVYVPHKGQTDYYVCQWNSDEWKHVEPVRPRHGVYPLTGKELAALLKQTWQEAINWADKDNGVDMTDAEEDGPIMNFSDFLKSKGIEL